MTDMMGFKSQVWMGLIFPAVLRVILAEQDAYRHQRSVYTAALGAWLAAPHDQELRRSAVSTEVLRACIEIEREGYLRSNGKGSKDLIFTEAYARIAGRT